VRICEYLEIAGISKILPKTGQRLFFGKIRLNFGIFFEFKLWKEVYTKTQTSFHLVIRNFQTIADLFVIAFPTVIARYEAIFYHFISSLLDFTTRSLHFIRDDPDFILLIFQDLSC
jgi:hypothetical protein